MNSNPLKILVLAKPGHFSDSLIALVKTIPEISLELRDTDWDRLPEKDLTKTNLVIVDQKFLDEESTPTFENLKSLIPDLKILLFTERIWQPNRFRSLAVDCVLPKSISSGEFLFVIQQLTSQSACHDRTLLRSSKYPISTFEPGMAS